MIPVVTCENRLSVENVCHRALAVRQQVKGEVVMRIGIAADHAGFALKDQLNKDLRDSGHEVVD